MRRLFAMLFALSLSPVASFALSVSYTTPIPVPISVPGSAVVDVQGFDPERGTLTTAFLDALFTVSGQATFTNFTPEPINEFETVNLISYFRGRTGYEFGALLDLFVLIPTGPIAPGESVVVSFTNVSSTNGSSDLGPLEGLITAGLVPIDFFTGEFVLWQGQFLTDISAQVTSGQVSIFYEYEPNQIQGPEPSTWLLLGAGLVGLAAAARRQRTRAGS